MTRKRWTGKALAERRCRTMHLHRAGFTQEEIADKLGVARPVVCRDLQSFRDASRSGDSPDLEEARFTQIERMKFDPTLPPLAGTFSLEDVAESWKGRRVYDPRVDGYGPQLKL
jgi:transcriptional regulator with XRE-family HTH domain